MTAVSNAVVDGEKMGCVPRSGSVGVFCGGRAEWMQVQDAGGPKLDDTRLSRWTFPHYTARSRRAWCGSGEPQRRLEWAEGERLSAGKGQEGWR